MALLAGLCAALGVLLGLSANAATGEEKWPGPLDLLRAQAWPMTGALSALTVLFAVVALVVERHAEPAVRSDLRPPVPPTVPVHFVAREQTREVAAAVCAAGREVGITTSLWGAGGFGKTLLAKSVCGDARVRRHFHERVYFITVGRDVRSRAEITAKVADVVLLITGDTSTPATDPEAAGSHLGRLLEERPRTLLVLDDVWEERQLAPFLSGGSRCVRLITTRNNGLLPDGAPRIRVDQMTVEQAEQVLTRDLPRLSSRLVEDLLTVTGRWALLLRLANQLLVNHVEAATDASIAAEDLLQQLRQDGPCAVDGPPDTWDLNDPDLRNQAVEASVKASAALLIGSDSERFTELCVFAEDEPIPLTLAAALWQNTGDLSLVQARLLCHNLARLSLITYDPSAGRISLHDVIRDYLRARTQPDTLAHLHAALVDSAAATLPVATPLESMTPDPGHAWWQIAEGYLQDHLIDHLLAAGQWERAEAVAGDIRWVEMRLSQRGPNAPWSDLTRVNTSYALSLARELARNAHLLTLTEPAHVAIHQLHARLQYHLHWDPQIQARRNDPALLPFLAPRWPLPDISMAAQRTLSGHKSQVWSVAWSAEGRLATADDRTVRVWNPDTGVSTELTGHTSKGVHLAWSADGRLATAGNDGKVRLWNPVTGIFTKLAGRTGPVLSVAWSADGRLATASASSIASRSVRIWDPDSGTSTRLISQTGRARSVAWSADGCLAIAGYDRGVWVWNPETDTTTELTGHTGGVLSVAWSADGRLATAGKDGTIRVWNPDTDTTTELTGHTGGVLSVAWSADGRLATAGGEVRVWDLDAGTWAGLPNHAGRARSVVWATDGRLATADDEGTVHVWDPGAGNTPVPTGHTGGVLSVAWSADGRLASAGNDGTIRLWNPDTSSTILTGHAGAVRSVAWSADGRLASVGGDGARVWDLDAGTYTRLTGHAGAVRRVAWSADGRLATTSATAVGSDGTVCVWDLEAGTCTEPASHAHGTWVVAWSADGRLATTDDAGWVRVHSPGTGTTHNVTVSSSGGWSVAWSADGRLATANDGTIRVWDLDGGTSTELAGHTGAVRSVSWSVEGRLATAHEDGTIRVWDVADGRVLTALRVDGRVTSCAWSLDGTALAAAGSRGLFLLDFRTV
ncbi:UNVERIFIED_CONTAM: WD40 repeat protein [Streptomyces canus]